MLLYVGTIGVILIKAKSDVMYTRPWNNISTRLGPGPLTPAFQVCLRNIFIYIIPCAFSMCKLSNVGFLHSQIQFHDSLLGELYFIMSIGSGLRIDMYNQFGNY